MPARRGATPGLILGTESTELADDATMKAPYGGGGVVKKCTGYYRFVLEYKSREAESHSHVMADTLRRAVPKESSNRAVVNRGGHRGRGEELD